MKTYSQILFLFVGGPQLGLQDEFTSRPQLAVHAFKRALQAGVAPIEVQPLGDTQGEDDVILFMHHV